MRIIGCEFRLSESEILGWLSCFGEVLLEITEERFESEGLDPELPPVGNGTYNVKMRLNGELPNWIPMFGRRISVEYLGMRRQCTNCYGPHAKKYCRSEKCGMEAFVIGFSQKYPKVPTDYYGKFSHLAKKTEGDQCTATTYTNVQSRAANRDTPRQSQPQLPRQQEPEGGTSQSLPNPGAQPVVKISLSKDTNGSWSTVNRKRLTNPSKESPSTSTDGGMADNGSFSHELNPGSTSVAAENVTSFINGIRATFRSENVIITKPQHQSKNTVSANGNKHTPRSNAHHGK